MTHEPLTPEQALAILWHVASNAVLIMPEGKEPLRGLTHEEHAILQAAHQALVGAVEQWRMIADAEEVANDVGMR